MKQSYRSALRQFILAGSATIALAAAGAASAQTAAKPPAEAATEPGEIVVTALKRSESVSRVPAAISVVQGDQLRTLGINSVSDLQNIAPGVNIGRDVFGVNINIRGVTTTDTTSKGEQGIAFNVDGVFIGRPVVQGLAFFDIDRVEVLRGPQGTLYGKSSTGGAINVISKKPAFDFGAGALIELGNFNTRRGEGFVNVPLSDSVAVRAAVNFNNHDGYLTPFDGSTPKNDQDDRNARVSALFKLGADGEIRFTGTFGHVGGIGPATVPLGNFLNASGDAKRNIYANPFGGRIDDNYQNYQVDLSYAFSGIQLNYLGAIQNYDAGEFTSSSNSPLGNGGGPPGSPQPPVYTFRDYNGTFKTDAHELRFSNARPGAIDWVVGANYNFERIQESDHNWNVPAATPTFAAAVNGIDPVNRTTHRSKGVFGQVTWHATDELGIVGGIRYSSDETVRVGTFAAGPVPGCVYPNDCIGGPNNGNQSANKVTWRAGVNYQITPTQLIYGSVATGYKAGGFNDFDPTGGPNGTGGTKAYNPENLIAYELGYKGLIAPGLRFNSSAFYYDYKAQQISSLVLVAGNVVIYTELTPTEIYGWENELKWQISPSDTLELAAAYQHSQYKSFQAGFFRNVPFAGKALDRTPEFVGSIAYSHVFDLGDESTLRFRAYTKISSSYVVSQLNAALQQTQPSYTRSDASLTYSRNNGRFTAELFVNNIENKYQMIGGINTYNATIPDAATVPISTPRLFGVRLGFKY